MLIRKRDFEHIINP